MNMNILSIQILCLMTFYTVEFARAGVLENGDLFVKGELNQKDVLDIIRRVERLEDSNYEVKDENRKLQEEVAGLRTYISSVKAETEKHVADLQSQITDLHKTNQQYKDEMQALVSLVQIDDLNKDLHITQPQTIAYKDETQLGLGDEIPQNDETEINVQDEEETTKESEKRNKARRKLSDASRIQNSLYESDQRRIVRSENEVKVAFYATVGQHHVEHAGANQAVVFDNVITNLGNAYSKIMGDFRAPVAGTYVFSVTLMAYAGHTTHYRIAKNGSGMGNIYLRGQDGAYATSALTAVLALNQGDNVSIQNIDPDEYLYGYEYSAFSGFLLQQDFSSQAIVGK